MLDLYFFFLLYLITLKFLSFSGAVIMGSYPNTEAA